MRAARLGERSHGADEVEIIASERSAVLHPHRQQPLELRNHTRLLQHFPSHGVADLLAQVHEPAWELPAAATAAVRVRLPDAEHLRPIVDDEAANPDDVRGEGGDRAWAVRQPAQQQRLVALRVVEGEAVAARGGGRGGVLDRYMQPDAAPPLGAQLRQRQLQPGQRQGRL